MTLNRNIRENTMNATISPHTLSDVVYVFLKNGGTLLHVEDGNNLKLVGNKEKNKCQSKL
jgi:hypothetical protein